MKLHLLLIILLASFSTAFAFNQKPVSEVLDEVDRLQREGMLDEAYALCDSLHERLDANFRSQYDAEIVPVRLEYNSEEMKMEADRERNALILRICLFAIVLSATGFGFVIFIKKQNKKVAESARCMDEATRKAEIAEKSKSLFLSNMTHEIRTPLNAISGFSELLTMEGIGEEMYSEAADIIEMNSRLLQNLIDDVVKTSCLDVTEMKFRIAPCNIVKIARNTTEMIAKMGKTKAEVRFESDEDNLTICTDALRVQQVLVNVLVNATKFCKQGSIVMAVAKDGNDVRVSVTDTGIGIPKDKIDGVFRRFERVKESAEGFGIGLSICRFIIERLDGRIWVDPDYTDGARFIFTLPLDKQVPEGQEGAMCL